MYKLVIILLLIPALCVSTHAQRLTSAEAVIDKYINAIGGKQALMKIKDLSFQSTVSYPGGSNPLTVKYKMPLNVLYLSTDAKSKVTYKQIIDGKKVFAKVGNKVTPTKPADVERTIVTAQLVPELLLAQKGIKYTLAGTQPINGKEAYKITYTLTNGSSWTTFYDTQTGLRVQTVSSAQNTPVTTIYSDYRDVNGIKLPYRFITGDANVKVSKYQMNTGISDAEFVIN